MDNLEPEDIKTLKRLARAVHHAYSSPWRLFLRGVLWGLATGLGATIVLAAALAVLTILFGNFIESLGLADTWNSFQQQINRLGQ